MTENLLLKYMSIRTNENPTKEEGTVITISREYGCEGYELAKLLYDAIEKRIKHKENHPKWKILCKEIIKESAMELHSSPEKLSKIVNSDERSILEGIISGKNYYSDNRIKKTMHNIIRKYAEQGNVIILGRAGCVITKLFPKTLHIRIIAPFKWRVNHVAEKHKLSLSDAKKKVIEIDNNRSNFIRYFNCDVKEPENFDIIFNRGIFSKEEIVGSIMNILEERKLI